MKIRFSPRFPSLLVAALLAVPAYAASDYLLELEGIPGESRVSGRVGTIELESFSVGVGSTVAGRASFSDISFTKVIDKGVIKSG